MTDEPPPELREAFGLWQREGLHPLATIDGYARLLIREDLGRLTDQQQQLIQNILTNTRRAMEVWHRTAAYMAVRYSRSASESVKVATLIDEIQERLQIYDVRLQPVVPEKLAPVVGDPYLLVTALCYMLYPPDQIPFCTNSALGLTFQHESEQTIGVTVVSALQLPPQEPDAQHWAWYPGSCLNIAAICLQHLGCVIAPQITEQGIVFTFTLPVAR